MASSLSSLSACMWLWKLLLQCCPLTVLALKLFSEKLYNIFSWSYNERRLWRNGLPISMCNYSCNVKVNIMKAESCPRIYINGYSGWNEATYKCYEEVYREYINVEKCCLHVYANSHHLYLKLYDTKYYMSMKWSWNADTFMKRNPLLCLLSVL